VFHQNRNGISTISHPVAKKSSRFRVDMRGLGALLGSGEIWGVALGTVMG
jgi:hypothetical protein